MIRGRQAHLVHKGIEALKIRDMEPADIPQVIDLWKAVGGHDEHMASPQSLACKPWAEEGLRLLWADERRGAFPAAPQSERRHATPTLGP